MDSPAFHDLTKPQQVLYFYCVRESHGQATRDDAMAKGAGSAGDVRLFYMNDAQAKDVHGLYAKSDSRGLPRDMAALIYHGFVDCLYRARTKGEKNLYRLSSRWNNWGTDDFTTPQSCKTDHMLNEEARLRLSEITT